MLHHLLRSFMFRVVFMVEWFHDAHHDITLQDAFTYSAIFVFCDIYGRGIHIDGRGPLEFGGSIMERLVPE